MSYAIIITSPFLLVAVLFITALLLSRIDNKIRKDFTFPCSDPLCSDVLRSAPEFIGGIKKLLKICILPCLVWGVFLLTFRYSGFYGAVIICILVILLFCNLLVLFRSYQVKVRELLDTACLEDGHEDLLSSWDHVASLFKTYAILGDCTLLLIIGLSTHLLLFIF